MIERIEHNNYSPPAGFKQVTQGKSKKGDFFIRADLSKHGKYLFEKIRADEVGLNCFYFDFLVREES